MDDEQWKDNDHRHPRIAFLLGGAQSVSDLSIVCLRLSPAVASCFSAFLLSPSFPGYALGTNL